MYRVELIDGRIKQMDAEAVAQYASIIKAFVLDEPQDFEGEAERLLSKIEYSRELRRARHGSAAD